MLHREGIRTGISGITQVRNVVRKNGIEMQHVGTRGGRME